MREWADDERADLDWHFNAAEGGGWKRHVAHLGPTIGVNSMSRHGAASRPTARRAGGASGHRQWGVNRHAWQVQCVPDSDGAWGSGPLLCEVRVQVVPFLDPTRGWHESDWTAADRPAALPWIRFSADRRLLDVQRLGLRDEQGGAPSQRTAPARLWPTSPRNTRGSSISGPSAGEVQLRAELAPLQDPRHIAACWATRRGSTSSAQVVFTQEVLVAVISLR